MRRFAFRLNTVGEAVSVDVFDTDNGPFCYAEEALAELNKLRADNEALRKQVIVIDTAHTELSEEVEALRAKLDGGESLINGIAFMLARAGYHAKVNSNNPIENWLQKAIEWKGQEQEPPT